MKNYFIISLPCVYLSFLLTSKLTQLLIIYGSKQPDSDLIKKTGKHMQIPSASDQCTHIIKVANIMDFDDA